MTYKLDYVGTADEAAYNLRISDDEMHAYIVMRSGDEAREEKLVYHRAKGE